MPTATVQRTVAFHGLFAAIAWNKLSLEFCSAPCSQALQLNVDDVVHKYSVQREARPIAANKGLTVRSHDRICAYHSVNFVPIMLRSLVTTTIRT